VELADHTAEELEEHAANYWNTFYNINKNKFFKERHYLHFQFAELSLDAEGNSLLDGKVVAEIGCGTGSTLYPLLEAHKHTFFYACDFAPNAIELVKKNQHYAENRCKAFVCDISDSQLELTDLSTKIESNSLDIALMVFVLSAIAPEKFEWVLQKVANALKPGGKLLFRDYGVYDMTHVRYAAKATTKKLNENYYVRGDGTRVYYFTKEGTTQLFERNGFVVDRIDYDTRELRNRKRKINMYRVWLNAKVTKK